MSAEMQARANALNARMEAEASKVLDDLERNLLRKVARASFSCAVKCYDTAGATGTSDVLEACARNCQVPYQQSSVLVQNEVSQFQNRLNRNMQECQERARDMITPGMDSVPKKVEDELLKCMSQQVDEHIKLLRPMKDRITAALRNYK